MIASPLEKVTFLLIALVSYNKKSTLVLPIYSSTCFLLTYDLTKIVLEYIYFFSSFCIRAQLFVSFVRNEGKSSVLLERHFLDFTLSNL